MRRDWERQPATIAGGSSLLRRRVAGPEPGAPARAANPTSTRGPKGVAGATGRRRQWYANFAGALVPLLLLKVALTGNQVWGTEGVEAPLKMMAKLPLFLGGDVLSAALLATLIVALARLLRVHLPVALPLQALHGFFAAFSSLSVVHIGGLVNKQFIEAAILAMENWTSQMGASTADYFDGFVITVLVASALAGGLLVVLLTRRPGLLERRPERVRRWLPRVLAADLVLTVGVVPFMTSGQIGVRIVGHDLEKSPWIELGWSYLRPPLRRLFAGDLGPEAEGFRFDFRSENPDGEPADRLISTAFTRVAPQRSNVVMILLESIGDFYLDDPADPMPYVRSLRDQPDTITFGQHYATWSLTTKVLFSILCSEMPYPTYKSISFINPSIPCVALNDTLHDKGYFTALVTAGDLDYDRKMRFLRHHKFDVVWDAKNMPDAEKEWRGAWGLEDRVAMDATLKAAQKAGDRPFFIVFNLIAGHHPFIANEEMERFPSATRVDNYMRSLRVADEATRGTVEGLDRLGLLDDTLVVIVSDHGEGHGRLAGRNAYQPVVRVPGIMFGPQTRGRGGRVNITTSQIDMAPTILGMLGLEAPCSMKGRDLTEPVERQIALFGGRPPKFQIGIADGRFNYILEDGSLEMLFDVEKDPLETHNLVDQHPALAARYKRRVELWSHHSAQLIENYASKMREAGCNP